MSYAAIGLMASPGFSSGQGRAYTDVQASQNYPGGFPPAMQLGIPFAEIDKSGRTLLYAMVIYNPTAPPVLAVGPVYWKDNKFQTVTSNIAEALVASGPNLEAGILLNSAVAIGDATIIQLGGYFGAGSSPDRQNGLLLAPTGGVTAGGTISAGATSQSIAFTAAGTASPYKEIGIVLTTAAAGAAFDVYLI